MGAQALRLNAPVFVSVAQRQQLPQPQVWPRLQEIQ